MRTTTQSWVWRAMVKSALIPLILVETVLVAIYLFSNQMIADANIAYISDKADAQLELTVRRETEIIRQQLLSVSRLTEIYRNETQQIIGKNIDIPNDQTEPLTRTKQGVLYSPVNHGGAASFYSSVTPVEQQDLQKVKRLSVLDGLMKQIKEKNPLIAAVYFNSWDSYNRIYPWFDASKQYPFDMKIPDYNFYYLADQNHNPLKTTVWTDVYFDPAGQGWMASSIAPVYNGDFLEGVVGLDLTIGSIVDHVLQLNLPWNGYALLVSPNGVIMALPKKGEQDFGLKELTKYKYNDVIRQEQMKPDEFNLFMRSETEKLALSIRMANEGKGRVELNQRNKIFAWSTIPETNWKFLTIIDEQDMYSEINGLSDQFRKIGYLMILGLVLFYVVFISYIWFRSKRMSRSISEPMTIISDMVGRISQEKYDQHSPDFQIIEINNAAHQIVDMGHKIQDIRHVQDRLKEEAVNANNTKTLFLSSMSHELRTPLNAILGFAQLLDNESFKFTEKEKQEYIREILAAGSHLLLLVDDLLNLANFDKEKVPAAIQPVDVKTLCKQCFDMVRPIVEKESLMISMSVAEDVGLIEADPTRIKQVILNFLTNAIKYNRTAGSIMLKAYRNYDHVRISVNDTGVGISPDKFNRIFEPFDRLGYETSDIKGTGIGLSIAKQLVESMSGRIGFSSVHEQGSTFWIEMPIAQSTFNQADQIAFDDVTAEMSRYQVICLTEDKSLCQQLHEHATEEFHVKCFDSVPEAKAYTDKQLIHVVMFDLRTDWSYEHIQALRKEGVVLLALTEQLNSELYQEFAHYLVLPLDTELCFSIIRKVVTL